MSSGQPILILFDGVCNLCNGTVDFIIQRDSRKRFQFASLQSEIGQRILKEAGLPSLEFSTFLLLENDKLYSKSTAFLRIVRRLDGLWPLLFIFILVPWPIRNFFYSKVAGNRYPWFGKTDTCRLPTPEEKTRFLG